MRRLLLTANLLDNFQRSGTITNTTLAKYQAMKEDILRVTDHKGQTLCGFANMVISDEESYNIHTSQRGFANMVVSDEESYIHTSQRQARKVVRHEVGNRFPP